MKRKIAIVLILLICCFYNGSASASIQDTANIRVNTDQLVYIIGEEIWVDGLLPRWDNMPQVVQVRLLNRTGLVMVEKQLSIHDARFDGYLEINAALPSDYYFIDCVVKGYPLRVQLQPVLLLHPQIPPSGPCNNGVHSPSLGNVKIGALPSLMSKSVYAPGESVNLQINNIVGTGMTNVYVRRCDRLSVMMDSIVSYYRPVMVHKSEGLIETEGHLISLRILQRGSGNPASELPVIASVSGQPAKLSTSVTDKNGVASFILPFLWDECNLVFSVMESTQQNYQFTLIPFKDSVSPIDFPCLSLNESHRKDIEARLFNSRMMWKYYGSQLIESIRATEDTTDFYGKPDQHYTLDDYTRFPNMEEILSEFVPEVRVRNSGSDNVQLQILDAPFKKYFTSQGLILLDGVPVTSTKDLLSMDPLLLKTIDVVSREYFLGRTNFGGVIQYKSYKKDLAGYKLGSNTFIVPFAGLQKISRPVFFDGHRKADNKPDLRNLLWRAVQLSSENKDNNITPKFNTGDGAGTYEVVILSYTEPQHATISRSKFTVQ